MAKRLATASKSTASLPADDAPLLADIKVRVQSARIKAGRADNQELLADIKGLVFLPLASQASVCQLPSVHMRYAQAVRASRILAGHYPGLQAGL